MIQRALVAFLILPGSVAIAAPPLLALIDPWKEKGRAYGLFLMLAGSAILLRCVRDFLVSGKGTLAPWDAPERMVVTGLYRHMRNPMYGGVILLVLGWTIYYASPLLAAYTVLLTLGFHLRVVVGEEPWLASQFGDQWERYRNGVPRWLPRARPWKED